MSGTLKDKAEEVGHKIAETATKVGHTVSEKVEEVSDWAKEKTHQAGHKIDEVSQKVDNKAKETFGSGSSSSSTSTIAEHMDVIASCGTKVGTVDHVNGSEIKLTKNDSPDGQHHLIPTSWVDHVDSHVHLNKNSSDVLSGWKAV